MSRSALTAEKLREAGLDRAVVEKRADDQALDALVRLGLVSSSAKQRGDTVWRLRLTRFGGTVLSQLRRA